MTELDELKEAIEYFEVSEFWANHSSDDNAKHSSNIYKAAQKYLELAPLLKEMIESRKKGTAGEWLLGTEVCGDAQEGDLPYLFAPDAKDLIGKIIARFDYSHKDRDFIKLAAKNVEKITEIMEIE